jgi:hypothetical protein
MSNTEKKYSVPDILNRSFDDTYKQLAVELVTQNPVTNTLERVNAIQGNASLTLGYTGDKVTTLTETIGANQYQTTITYTGDLITGISEVVKL